MRCLLPCLVAALAAAGGSSYDRGEPSVGAPDRPIQRATLEADADQLQLHVRITVTAATRAEADSRLRTLSAKINTRFEDQEGVELERLEHTFARPKGGLASSFLGKSDKDDDSFTATATWAFRAAIGDNPSDAAERLRGLAADLVDPKAVKAETESIRVGEIGYRLSNPEDYRDPLLHRIREDAAAAARHLPKGENQLELPSLEERVRLAPLTSSRFVLWLPYTLKHKSKVTAADGHCDCEPGEPTVEPEMDDGHDHDAKGK